MRSKLVSLLPVRAIRGRLFCIHHAGGGAATFADWARLLGPHIQVGTVLLPGRERLFGEPPATDMASLVERISDEIQTLGTDQPYALFGHSLGAVIAFEVSCRLERRVPRPPSGLILSGRGAVHLDDEDELDRGASTSLPADELVDLLRRMGGTPPEVLGSPELLELILPRIRADFSLAESYRWDGRTRSKCPALVLGGTMDRSVNHVDLARWGELTAGELDVHMFDGDHFFVTARKAEVCRVIEEFLMNRLSMA